MTYEPFSRMCVLTSAGHEEVLTPFTSFDFLPAISNKGVFSMDGLWSSIDNAENLLVRNHDEGVMKSNHPDIGNDAMLTSNSWLSYLMKEPLIPSQDCVDSPLTPETTSRNALKRFEIMYADKLPPKSVSAATTNPVCSGPSRELEAGMTDNTNQSRFEQTNTMIKPTDVDVLFGRGGLSNHHPGNKLYHLKKLEILPCYKAPARADTASISQELVDAVHAWGGRFLKLEEGTKDRWYEVSKTVARKKASQALRELNTPEYRASKRSKYTS